VAGSCECGDEPSGSGATELVTVECIIQVLSYHSFFFVSEECQPLIQCTSFFAAITLCPQKLQN
jgi:hypothetical protein